MVMNIVLVEPEIPQNTGNIARTCAVTNSSLYLVKPLGFSTEDKYLKRAGLDYWDKVDVYYYDSIFDLIADYNDSSFYFASTKAPQSYDQVIYKNNDFLVFGKETAGLPESLLKKYLDYTIRIPMGNELRSLNLANSVAIILYEGLRQLNFPSLVNNGLLRNN
ncbi:tRNA (uridine(34)/cytosine(34)/5-carboxymethylaminomethyluridine(34)-2'-O)-methyltransferase TrmL [Iocasia frigidifontis]|uniref:Putative tRNA (cytidine(34)-2'-O)-methyltransferase n=2 Tax=Halanaerobiales TaxID=53433 RepID=A0A8A7KIR5_9FIRM|nr:tRNA (uridine(34)/cytosine(34)/5-carboxymethylaminomethyluridine(34)-2'-O)-methyltransferase TrmL [Halocella sp. SP3-1]QTL99975.1 tRNA (uridine(34)/cytosine(34)/5-carboxymethylaminomethyluridine(34)-2'-O)-methyltransferase TrmL [Iocasia fonsfrigidae]